MSKKNKDAIRVSFLGENSEDVTGSCTLITIGDKKILLECGLYQSCNSVMHDYKINSENFKFKAKDIDFVFVGHCHIDHIGRIPLLYKRGFRGKVISPTGTKMLSEILLRDSAFIMSKDAEFLNRKKNSKVSSDKYYEPIYCDSDVDICMENWLEYSFDSEIKLSDEIKFKFISSGHIVNSAQIVLWLKHNGNIKKVLYTSDIGNKNSPKIFASPIQSIKNANLVIGECTYAQPDRNYTKKDRRKDLEKLKSVIESTCVEKHKKVLIPVFANDRCQNIIMSLYEIFGSDKDFKIPIVVDSPMACRISELYKEIIPDKSKEDYEKALAWDNVKFVKEYEESSSYQKSSMPMVVLASSGFMTAGRSQSWAQSVIQDPECTIMFCGFAHPNSLAGKIKTGDKKTITISGKSFKNKCNVVILNSFSSHMQHDDLLDYYSKINTPKIALVHGDFLEKCKFTTELQNKLFSVNKTGKVICVNRSTEILI